MTAYREGLPERPPRMRSLPLNDKGYPIPWFVETLPDGSRDFRIMDGHKWVRAVRDRLCWLCGERMGAFMTFVAGPMCGINRTSAEPPSHHDCAEYAALACPFLTLPKAVRREAGLPEEVKHHKAKVTENHVIGGTAITRNPGVTLLWTTQSYQVHKVDNGRIIEMGAPCNVEWFAEGKPATRAQVEESIRTGMPYLQEMADKEGPAAQAMLLRYVDRFMPLLPLP
jgi:hypothetical protein